MNTYTGGCHCGAVTFRVEADLTQTMVCNCSHCQQRGLILNFVPKAKFELLSGKENLSEYLFNKKIIQHLFCKTCGLESFAYGKSKAGEDTVMINVRSLEGIDIDSLKSVKFNGRDLM